MHENAYKDIKWRMKEGKINHGELDTVTVNYHKQV